ncbi:MAG: hypothetical protein RJQ09_03905 [Cyclobacteriaceae bacterium]
MIAIKSFRRVNSTSNPKTYFLEVFPGMTSNDIKFDKTLESLTEGQEEFELEEIDNESNSYLLKTYTIKKEELPSSATA